MTFEQFWEKYPWKAGKKEAEKAWNKVKWTEKSKARVETGLEEHLNYWAGKSDIKLPRASTWINQERWNDDVAPKRPSAARKVPQYQGPAKYSEGLTPAQIRERMVQWATKKPLLAVEMFAATHTVLKGKNEALWRQIGADLKDLCGEEEFRKAWKRGRRSEVRGWING